MIFDKIFNFFKNIFGKKKVKELPTEVNNNISLDNKSFEDSLKENVVNQNKKKIKTLVCVGTGLGINDDISYL